MTTDKPIQPVEKLTNLKPSRQINARLIQICVIAITVGFAGLFIFLSLTTRELRYFLLASTFTLSLIFGIISTSALGKTSSFITVLMWTFFLEASIVLLSGVFPAYFGVPYIVIAIFSGLLLSTLEPQGGSGDWIIYLGLIGAIAAFQIHILAPLPQVIDARISTLSLSIAIFLLLIVLFLFSRRNIVASLRTKLILGSLAISLIPLTILAVINNRYLQTAIQNQSNQSLTVAAKQTTQAIDNFISTSLDSLVNESTLPSIISYINLDQPSRSNSNEEAELKVTLQTLQTKQKIYLPSYAIINAIGENIFDTDQRNIGKSELDTSYFKATKLSGSKFVTSVEFDPNSRGAFINFINPVKNENAQIIGYLRARYDARILQTIIESNIGIIGSRSYPILLADNGLRLADGFSPNQIYRSVIDYTPEQYKQYSEQNTIPANIPLDQIVVKQDELATAIKSSGSRFFTANLTVQNKNISHSGTVEPLSTEPWHLVYLQDQAGLTTALANQNRLSSTLSTIMAGIIGILVTIVANLFSSPILRLTHAAEKVTSGDLSIQAKVTSNDELGVLGNSFNMMTRQLKEFIDSLESRVQERTLQLAKQNESLQFRSRQLQTVADVARTIVSTREIDTLLTDITSLVSQRFGFYHTGIFLLDASGEYAVLRAANSTGGQKMLERQHRLKVGQVGIVGYVTGSGEPRIATDVGEDAVYFNNPDLPETKSEMALPLKLENKIIGALDVQSRTSNAFTEEDVELFTTLADQIAIAINNSQLFAETNKALEESQNLYRQYLRQEWTQQNSEFGSSYKYTPAGLEPYKDDLPEIKMVLNSARPVFRTHKSKIRSGEINSVMAVPIVLRGESIGAIHLQESGEQNYVWSQNELSTVQAVADQVAQTLENARLFEQTIRRSDRDRKVLEITSKIRSTNDPQEMLRIALEELKRNLGAEQAQIVINVPEPDQAGMSHPEFTQSHFKGTQEVL